MELCFEIYGSLTVALCSRLSTGEIGTCQEFHVGFELVRQGTLGRDGLEVNRLHRAQAAARRHE